MLLWFQSTNPQTFFYFFLFWLCQVSAVACWVFSCGMWDPVPQPGIEPGPPCTGPPEKFPQPSLTHSCSLFSPLLREEVLLLLLSVSSDPLDPSLSRFYQEALHPCTSFPHPLFFILWIPQHMDTCLCVSFSKNQWWVHLKHSFGPTAPSPPDSLLFSSSQQNFSKCMSTHCLHPQTPFSPPLTALNRVTDKLYVAIPKVVYLLPSCNLNSQELSKRGPLPHSSTRFPLDSSTPSFVSSSAPALCFSLPHAPPLPWPRR